MTFVQIDANQGDRRSKPRINCNYAALVRTIRVNGAKLDTEAQVRNLSANGLFLQLDHPIAPGQRLFVLVNLSSKPTSDNSAFRIATRGVVVRSVSEPEGKIGVAVKFHQYRFL